MARIVPTGWRALSGVGALAREVETLTLLAGALPAEYTVYHGVHWTRIDRGRSVYGEIDFVVVEPSGRILVIEQKSGFLDETVEGLVKKYAHGEKRVAAQLARSIDALQSRFSSTHGGGKLDVEYLFYCPDYRVRAPGSAGVEAARIVDAGRRAQLPAIVCQVLPPGPPQPRAGEVHRFLSDVLELVPEIGAIAEQAQALSTRLSGGLATWGRRIECDPFRLRVTGTAGSGKTQLALASYREAVAAGRRPLYVCYNRPLADHFATLVPEGGLVATYHQLCAAAMRELGETPDFSRPEPFRELEARFAGARVPEGWRFGELIVDEGQDFHQEWVEPLLRLLAPGGRAWWLEDPMQNLYGRPPVSLPGWIGLRSDTNYRSPREVLDRLNRVIPMERRIEAGSPVGGSDVDILTYADAPGLVEATKRAIAVAFRAGFKPATTAIVTFRGRESSALATYTVLGPHRLEAFTGTYDLLGSPVWTEGDLLIDTVYRFKGRAAPCVIFTEIDFEALDDLAVRKLFVGATRATLKLVLVLSERAAGVLLDRLEGRT